MIVVQAEHGLEFWQPELVASFVPEFRQYWRVVHANGRVAHIPSAPPEGPWVPLGNALVQPRWLTPSLEGWRDPAGFLLGQGALPEVAAPPPPPALAELPYPPDEIYALTIHPEKAGRFLWLTDHGPVEGSRPAGGLAVVAPRHPNLVLLKDATYLNRRRLRGVRRRDPRFVFTLDNGEEYFLSGGGASGPAARRLGLTSLAELPPYEPVRFGNYQLRDWPIELARAPAEFLRANFKTPRKLIAHLIWQRFRMLSAGDKRKWADSYRGFWYESVAHALSRAGLLKPVDSKEDLEKVDLYHVMFKIFDLLVETAGFFRLMEFGLAEPDPERTKLGKTRPEVVVVTEKDDLLQDASKICRELGLTHYHLGGQPPRLRTEYLVSRLRAKTQAPLWIIAFVDYDEAGWTIGRAVVKQLMALGVTVERLDFLLREECFTDEEIRLYAHPCPSKTKALQTLSRLWVESGGGIRGEALGIHASHVKPFRRVRKLFLDLLTPPGV